MCGLHACVYAHVWRSKISMRSLPWSLYIPITEAESLSGTWSSLIQACPASRLVLETPLVFWVSESQVGPHTHQLLSGVWGSKLRPIASWEVLYLLRPPFSPHKACYLLTPFPLFLTWIQATVLDQCLLSSTPMLEPILHRVDKEAPSNPWSESHAAANWLHLPLVISKPLPWL